MQELESKPRAVTEEKPDAHALLAAANSASERVSGLHVAFMAVCVYVLVIVFGTTDLDQLMGKGVRLPIVSVDVPIVGFYAFAPYIVVLVHFNLLLQLQLLSRKLYAFDAAAPQQENLGGLRDQLHIIPYTYYLVGRPSPLVRALVGLMVSITVVLLPLATLLALQLQFLAYQDQVITWWQRAATWLDLAVIVTLWPIILDSQDDWRRFWHALIAAHVPRRRAWAVFTLLLAGLVFLLFSGGKGLTLIGVALLLLTPLAAIPLGGWKKTSRARILNLILLGTAALIFVLSVPWLNLQRVFLLGPLLIIPLLLLWHPQAPRGSLALLMTLFIGSLVPVALLVDGEGFERFALRVQRSQSTTTAFSEVFLFGKRRLDLSEQLLLAKPPKPEVIALIRSGNWQDALKQIESINLQGRSLRHANMYKAILIGGELRNTDLREAYLKEAKLQAANLKAAELQGANLSRAHLQGADLAGAQLQGAYLVLAQLQGASLSSAQLQGAIVSSAQLQGADLFEAQLQGANLRGALLHGADLMNVALYGALYGVPGVQDYKVMAKLVDIRKVDWKPLTDKDQFEIVSTSESGILETKKRRVFLNQLEYASRPGAIRFRLISCLAQENTPLICVKRFNPEKPEELHDFTRQLHTYLGKLACKSPEIAHGIIRQISAIKTEKVTRTDSTRRGLRGELKKRLDDKKCAGLQGLSDKEKKELRDM